MISGDSGITIRVLSVTRDLFSSQLQSWSRAVAHRPYAQTQSKNGASNIFWEENAYFWTYAIIMVILQAMRTV